MAIKEICCLIWTTLMLATVICSPTSRPIEHSPSDLAWDDWLQQGSRQAPPPRRITTKSLFVFPNLGTESLPACAEGYRPDSMGRCVKVVKVDENAHLQFILDKLNSQFAIDSSGQDEVYDYEGLDGDNPEGSGPFQLSIPIAQHQIKGPESDEIEGSGDEIVLHKKEMSEKPTNPQPTSSPEIVPEYVNSESIYLDNAALTSNLQPNIQRNSTGSLSILPANKTDSGLTVFVSSNGKYGNVTAQTQTMKNETDLVDQLENIKQNTTNDESSEHTTIKNTLDPINLQLNTDNDNKKINRTSSIANPLDNTQEITTKVNLEIKTDDEKAADKLEESSIPSVSQMDDVENTESEIKIAEMLVEQIETLKQQVANKLLELKQQNNEVHHKTTKRPDKLTTFQPSSTDYSTSTLKPLNLNDIEEKIKRISLFADVTTNAESRHKLEAINNNQKHSQEQTEDFVTNQNPNTNSAHYFTQPYPVSNIHRTGPVSNRNGIYGVVQEERPFWWPSNGWAIDNQPNEENFRDYWSRGPTVNGNPFGVRYEGEHHPAPHPLLYPSIRERDRISVRHTSINHRRGREGRHRKRQIQHDGNQYYLKKSPDIVNMMQTYDGR